MKAAMQRDAREKALGKQRSQISAHRPCNPASAQAIPINSRVVKSGGESMAQMKMKMCATESCNCTLNNGTLCGTKRNH
jgi:hypothetical protein